MLTATFLLAALIAPSFAIPLNVKRATPTTGVILNPSAIAEAQQRDNNATRAFTGVPIKTNAGLCLFVDPTSGNDRENHTPVQIKACDGSSGQKWDVITSGEHDDQAGFALIVSSLTNACLNFDSRKSKVDLFSCGGRADGSGHETSSQLFPFKAGQTTLALAPQNGKNAICLVPNGGVIDQTTCSGGADQLFTFGNAGGKVASPPPPPATTTTPVAKSTTTSKAAARSSSHPANTITALPPGVTTGVKLDSAATAEAQQRDNTATRAFTNVPIKTNTGLCLFVDETSGDFRENLTPVQTRVCDGSKGQAWDVITSGKHDNQPGFALVVSSLTNACLNFDPRRASGNQVLLFSCGGRADGSGQVTDSQLFPFKAGQTTFALAPQNGKNAVCLVPKGGLIDQTSCSGAADQLFTIGNGNAAPPPPPPAPATSTTSVAKTTSTTKAATSSTSPPLANTNTALPPGVTTGVKLDAAATAEAQQKDNTATRAFTSVPIKTNTGLCLFVDATSGDFRENLTPVQTRVCDGSAGQKWDVITSGKHDNQPGFALIVSSLTNACLNFDPRRAAGNQVLLFSCGGRADGGGAVTDSQLFPFKAGQKTLALAPQSGKNAVCLVPKGGLIDQSSCTGSNDQLFTIG